MNLDCIRDALLAVGVPVYHYHALEQTDRYIVWAEDGQADAVWADGEMQEQAIQGTVDYFTKTEYDAAVRLIQNVLNGAGVSWRLNSIQYEWDTSYIHHEFTWQVMI